LLSTCLRNASESIDVNEQNGQSVNRAAAVVGGVGSIFSLFPFCSNNDRTDDSSE
jgi:hypothetical protein